MDPVPRTFTPAGIERCLELICAVGGIFKKTYVSRYHVLPFVAEAHIPKEDVAVCFYIREFKGYYERNPNPPAGLELSVLHFPSQPLLQYADLAAGQVTKCILGCHQRIIVSGLTDSCRLGECQISIYIRASLCNLASASVFPKLCV